MADFKKLHVWRKAHALALNVHHAATRIRGSQYTALRSQLLRAAMSIPANIVEGKGQRSPHDFRRFLGDAIQSSAELEYHLIVAHDTRRLARAEYLRLLEQLVEVRRMLHGLAKHLDPRRPPPDP